MLKIIKQIKKIMGDHWSSEVNIKLYNNGIIIFYIYESEIPIVVNANKDEVYLDCECHNGRLTVDMLQELHDIARVLKDNIEVLREV